MFATLMRFGALLAAPLVIAGTAAAQYDEPQDEAALILFSGEDYTGSAVNVFDPIYSLPDIDFNDRARSVAVLSGAWEICEHSDFTGRCVFLREDVPDLRYYGLERQASSVRPIYEYTDAEHGLMFFRDDNGYIRYADDVHYGSDDYAYGYGSTRRVEVYHYGYSPAYRSYGYYDPLAGYGPYGFGYSRGGYNTYYAHRHQPRPLRGHYGARDADATLYVDSNGRGASLGINHGVKDLSRYRFNDNVSSLNIKSGKWEVCEHANFQGRCEIIDASTGRVNGIRLNDNISSIRPVDGDRTRDNNDDHRGRNGDRADRPRDGDRRQGRSGGDRSGDGGRRGADALAGGPSAVPSLPDTTLNNRQPRATPSYIPPDPVAKAVRPPRGERARREGGRPVADTAQSPASRDQSRRTQDRPERARVDVPRSAPQRVLPQTPAMRSQQPVQAPVQAPQVRAPVQAAPQERVAPAPAPAPVRQVQSPRARPEGRPDKGNRQRHSDRVGNNQN